MLEQKGRGPQGEKQLRGEGRGSKHTAVGANERGKTFSSTTLKHAGSGGGTAQSTPSGLAPPSPSSPPSLFLCRHLPANLLLPRITRSSTSCDVCHQPGWPCVPSRRSAEEEEEETEEEEAGGRCNSERKGKGSCGLVGDTAQSL